MYQLLFAKAGLYDISYWDRPDKLSDLQPDLLILNSNVLSRDADFPEDQKLPTILLCGKERIDLRERAESRPEITIIEKPFFPYDLLSAVNQILSSKTKKKPKTGRKKAR